MYYFSCSLALITVYFKICICFELFGCLWQLADSHRFDLKGQGGITSNIYSSLIYSYMANEKKDHFILFTHEVLLCTKQNKWLLSVMLIVLLGA